MLFQYHEEILAGYPEICGGVIYATAIANGPTSPELARRFEAEQAATRARIQTALSELPSLAAWRQAFRRFGANPTKYRSAAEALLRRLTKKGDIPSINTLVDLANLVSIRYALPVAAFDTGAISGCITVRPATGREPFRELGSADVLHPEPGEVVFCDQTERVVARRWCWRQSAESAARAETQAALITVEAQHPAGRIDVERAVADLEALLHEFVGAQTRHAILDADHPAFSG